MKLVPLLIITNALALGGCIWLFLEQQDLSDRLATARNTGSSRAVAGDPALLSRLDQLEAQFNQRVARERAIENAFADESLPADLPQGGEGAAQPVAGDPLSGLLAGLEAEAQAEGAPDDAQVPVDLGSSPKMDDFRRLVRRANDLNEEEDRVREVLGRLDRLVEGSRISPISEENKVAVARTLLTVRSSIRDRMRQASETTDVRSLPPEQRREIFRTQIEAIQAETQSKLEQFLPAPDAKLVAESTLRGGDLWGRGPGGGGPGQRAGGTGTSGRTR